MQPYIAMLRGINVSGQKKIKMADLRELLTKAGLKEVQTYIQSGNVIFKHKPVESQVLENTIEEAIKSHYGFDVPVFVKTPADLEKALAENPYLKDETIDPARLCFTFLSDEPRDEHIEKLASYNYAPEEYVLDGTMLYFHSPGGFAKAKMSNNFFEQKLKVNATSRNAKTVKKLLGMAGNS